MKQLINYYKISYILNKKKTVLKIKNSNYRIFVNNLKFTKTVAKRLFKNCRKKSFNEIVFFCSFTIVLLYKN